MESDRIRSVIDTLEDEIESLEQQLEHARDTDERVMVFPNRHLLVIDHAQEQTRDTTARFAHLQDQHDSSHMFKIDREDVWQAPHATLDALLDDFRSVVPDTFPKLEEYIERKWEQAHTFELRTVDGHAVLSCDDPEDMKDIALKELEYPSHYSKKISSTRLRITNGAVGEVKQQMYAAGYPVQDLRDLDAGDPLNMSVTVDPYPHQNEWVRRYMDVGSGVYVGPSGSGKTVAALLTMEAVDGETLILVPRRELVTQWKSEIVERTDLNEWEIGEYHGDRKQVKKVTLATYHTAAMSRHKDIFHDRNWGLVIFDECHYVPSRVFKRTTDIQTKHRLGLSASPVREDENHDKIFTLIGQPIGTDWSSLFEDGYVQNPDVTIQYVPWQSDSLRDRYGSAEGHDKRQIASMNPKKLEVIRDHLEDDAKTIISVEWLDHGDQISEEFDIPFINGSSTHSTREDVLERFRDGDINAMIVSRIGDEGLDIPDADRQIIASGLGGSRRQGTQRSGRVMRPEGDAEVFFLATKGSNEKDFMREQTQHMIEKGISVSEEEWE